MKEMSKEITVMQSYLKEQLVKAQEWQATHYNKTHYQRIFNVGDSVMLQMKHLHLDRLCKKLNYCCLGPF